MNKLPKKTATRIGMVYQFESKHAESMQIFGDLVALVCLTGLVLFTFGGLA